MVHDFCVCVGQMDGKYLDIPGRKSVTVSSTPYSSGRVTGVLYSFHSDTNRWMS